jgi:hypothetical protein
MAQNHPTKRYYVIISICLACELTNRSYRPPSMHFLNYSSNVLKLALVFHVRKSSIPNDRVKLLLGLLLNIREQHHREEKHEQSADRLWMRWCQQAEHSAVLAPGRDGLQYLSHLQGWMRHCPRTARKHQTQLTSYQRDGNLLHIVISLFRSQPKLQSFVSEGRNYNLFAFPFLLQSISSANTQAQCWDHAYDVFQC